MLAVGVQLTRASMALRGVRPSIEELEQVIADPTTLEDVVDSYLDDPRFGETMADMYSERLLLRDDIRSRLDAVGPLAGVPVRQLSGALADSPLRLVSEVAMDERPLTDLVTTDQVWTDWVLHEAFDAEFDPSGPEWQATRWTDGRPAAGLLSHTSVWLRHPSNGQNYNRGRAEVIADTFLCSSFASVDTPVLDGLDLSDDEAVANAVQDNPACATCHSDLDPLAATLWVYTPGVPSGSIEEAYDNGCTGTDANMCYPLQLFHAERQDLWERKGLRPPGFFGTPVDNVGQLGQLLSDDPAFGECAARTVYAYLAQIDREEVSEEVVNALVSAYDSEGGTARALARAAVLSDTFMASSATETIPDPAGVLVIRPEQHARLLDDLTGFRWLAEPDRPSCVENHNCYGQADLLASDAFGFRSLSGGVDGRQVTTPSHVPSPVRERVWASAAIEAAAWTVRREFAAAADMRRLLTAVETTDSDETLVRAQLAALHLRLFGEQVPPEDSRLDPAWALFSGRLDSGASVENAWTLTLAALLQDPALVMY